MKTRNLIFNALISAMICGSAFALSADERHTFCEKHPEKYVWIEKTQSCVPVNPCLSNNDDIKNTYCIVNVPIAATKMVTDKYVEKVLHVGIDAVKDLGDGYIAYYAANGNYFVFNAPWNTGLANGQKNKIMSVIDAACWAYGLGFEEYDSLFDDKREDSAPCSKENANIDECSEIADFATMLHDDLCTGKIQENYHNTCYITCEKKDTM